MLRHVFRPNYNTLYLALLTMWWADDCSLRSSSLIRRVISDLALATASSCELSIARYSLRSPSGGGLPGGTYVPRTVMPASEYSLIKASASCKYKNLCERSVCSLLLILPQTSSHIIKIRRLRTSLYYK